MVDGVLQQRTAAEQRASYDDRGYVIVPNLLTPSEIAGLRAALVDLLKEAEGLTTSNDRFFVVVGDDGQRHVTRVRHPNGYHDAFRELISNPNLLDLVETLIGPDIQFVNSKINLKPPRNESFAYPWHQEWPFNPHTNFDQLTVTIPLEDTTEQNGCLRVIPGSHKDGPVPHEYGRYFGVKSEELVKDCSRHVSLVVPAGGVTAHHCCLLHSSTPNFSTASRDVIFLDYRSADNVQLHGAAGPGRGLLVRGKDSLSVRMVAGTFNIRDTPRPPG